VPIPPYEHYEEFPQIENGVGLIAAMRDEIDTELEYIEIPEKKVTPKTVVTSYIAYDFIRECVSKIKNIVPDIDVDIVKIKNDFFGDKITVTGLICGNDIINQLKGKLKNKTLLLSESMFKSDEDIFLDDSALCDVEDKLGVKIIKTPNTGYGFIKSLLETEV
jgi:NifB/MoaA-like Fe-S oxidoreductase